MQIRDEDSNFFSETIALQTNESVGGGPPESEEEEEETSREQVEKTEYYKRPNEQIGLSLFRDSINRQKRSKVAVLATDLKARILQATKFEAPKTNQYLTEKLERNIDFLLKEWVGPEATQVTQEKVYEVLTNLGVFQDYSSKIKAI